MMIDPSPVSRFPFPVSRNSRPTGTPAIVRSPPKFVWTSTPTVQPPNCAGSLRLDVPIPPFHPNATVPRPAPTAPSATGPSAAARMALRTSASGVGRAWHAQRAGQHDRRLQLAELIHLRGAGKLAKSVSHDDGRRNFLPERIAPVR